VGEGLLLCLQVDVGDRELFFTAEQIEVCLTDFDRDGNERAVGNFLTRLPLLGVGADWGR